eukprot:3830554-Pleurochrysis_carterae.AAC.1
MPSASSACRSARRQASPAAAADSLPCPAGVARRHATAASTASCTAPAADWFAPAAAINCA